MMSKAQFEGIVQKKLEAWASYMERLQKLERGEARVVSTYRAGRYIERHYRKGYFFTRIVNNPVKAPRKYKTRRRNRR